METTDVLVESEVRNDFQALTKELDKWGDYVDDVINKGLNDLFGESEHVQKKARHRVKDIDSYCEKVLLRVKPRNPLLEITDKVGTRVVLLDRDDVKKVSHFVKICEDWIVQEQTRDTETVIFEHPDVFTYQSDHFIVKPKDEYDTADNRDYITCEIQIRTILQHAYAEISHDTVYKKSTVTNKKAQRLLASSMAMIEAADERFVSIYKELQSDENYFASLQSIVIEHYKEIIPEYSEFSYDVDIANRLLFIYNKEELDEMLAGINSFVNDQQLEVRLIIQHYLSKCILFKHPVVLVALFGILHFQNKTRINWPYSSETLDAILESMNISKDSIN